MPTQTHSDAIAHKRTHIHTYTNTHIHTHQHIHTHTYTHKHAHTLTYPLIHPPTHAPSHSHTYTHTPFNGRARRYQTGKETVEFFKRTHAHTLTYAQTQPFVQTHTRTHTHTHNPSTFTHHLDTHHSTAEREDTTQGKRLKYHAHVRYKILQDSCNVLNRAPCRPCPYLH